MKKYLYNFSVWYVFSGVVFVLLIYFLFMAIRIYHGFCYQKNEYIKEEEKIDNAIEHVMSIYPPVTEKIIESGGVKKLKLSRAENSLSYASVSEFKKINPNCCEITLQGRRGISPSFYDRLLGRLSEFVKIRYLLRYYDENSNLVSEEIVVYVGLSNCGYVWSGF